MEISAKCRIKVGLKFPLHFFSVSFFHPSFSPLTFFVLVKYLQQVCVCDSKLKNIIVGDFNLRDIDWTSGECPCDDINLPFYSVVTELVFIQSVSSATRDSSLLDLVFTDDPLVMSNIETRCPFSTSDHALVAFDLLLPFPSNSNDVKDSCSCFNESYYDFKCADYTAISAALSVCDWDVLFDSCSDVECAWAVFIDVINSVVAQYVPVKLSRKCCASRFSSYSKNITRMLHKKRRLWKNYRQSRTVSSRQQYNSMAKHCREELYNSKI